ncbi:MAG: hypothetical protein MZV64_29165 [Ignavibacteriales bacterium]|nr:hypothetical protein [Ignavibacteriales bacterium]
MDYPINYKGKVIPAEVKSGASGKMRSLNIFMNLSDNQLSRKILLWHVGCI